jgi:hypothetical protein
MWAVVVARVGTGIIDVCSFWLSATTLTDLAVRAGTDPRQAWMWPVIVDGMIVVATVAVVALARHGARATVYPWALLAAGAGVSVAANCLHAVVAAEPDLPVALAVSVAAVPPLMLLASTHLTVQLGRRVDTSPAAAGTPNRPPGGSGAPRAVSGSDRRQQDAPPPAPRSSSGSAPGTARLPKASPTVPTPQKDQALAWSAEGLSNRAIATRLSVHPSTVGRWLGAPTPPEGQDAHAPRDTSAHPAMELAAPTDETQETP